MSNVCALNQFQKQCFVMFYYILLCTLACVVLICELVLFIAEFE